MIEIIYSRVVGLDVAMHAMRNPMDSWSLGDTTKADDKTSVGIMDMALSSRLIQAGPSHRKHLRFIIAYAEIIAPRYWWMEFNTHRAGMEMLSCSTMHTLTRRNLAESDFSRPVPFWLLEHLNHLISWYKKELDPDVKQNVWRELINTLPQGYMQRRTVMMSYECLRNMYALRKDHKLQEWRDFCEWVETLPYSGMITEEVAPSER